MELLPYFKFNASEYLLGDITDCSLSAQGLFINLCALYWQRGGKVEIESIKRRIWSFSEADINELLKHSCIYTDGEKIGISFLKRQLSETAEKHQERVASGRKGGLKRQTNITENSSAKTDKQAQLKHRKRLSLKDDSSSALALRTDKIRTEQIGNTTEGSSITYSAAMALFGSPKAANAAALWAALAAKVGLAGKHEKGIREQANAAFQKIITHARADEILNWVAIDALSPGNAHLFAADKIVATVLEIFEEFDQDEIENQKQTSA